MGSLFCSVRQEHPVCGLGQLPDPAVHLQHGVQDDGPGGPAAAEEALTGRLLPAVLLVSTGYIC